MGNIMRSLLPLSFAVLLIIVLSTSAAEVKTKSKFEVVHVLSPKAFKGLTANRDKIPEAFLANGVQKENYLYTTNRGYVPINNKPERTFIIGDFAKINKSLNEGPQVFEYQIGKYPFNLKESADMFDVGHISRGRHGEFTLYVGNRKFAAAMERGSPVHYQENYVGMDTSPLQVNFTNRGGSRIGK